MKQCNRCMEQLEFSEFYPNPRKKDQKLTICKQCISKQNKEKYNINKTNILKRNEGYRNKNPDKIKSYNKNYFYKYYHSNSAKQKDRSRFYRLNNKAYFAFTSSCRRANIMKATPKWADLEKIKQFYLNCPIGFEVDHIIPLKNIMVCGLHVIDNLQYLSISENRKKKNKLDL